MPLQEYKICPVCEKELQREEFRYGGQIRRYCKSCYPDIVKQYQAKNSERIKKYHIDYCARPEYLERQRRIAKEIGQKYRRVVLEHYGGSPPRCACCGESNYEFLVLDHINGGGVKHRKEVANGLGGLKMYIWTVRNNFPSIFRVLCSNCNSSYGSYGYCPHQKNLDVQ